MHDVEAAADEQDKCGDSQHDPGKIDSGANWLALRRWTRDGVGHIVHRLCGSD
jgi:hypothetical protein